MFEKILIANRGEIACRVIKTARRMGIRTVAVYSDADANALHVKMADEAVHIGAAPSRESYLLSDRVLAAARQTGAQAIHPGYGFLSENTDFSQACAEAGVVFIGPPAKAIEAMGSKSAAKRIMEEAGVPLVPGYHGEDQDPALLRQHADDMGYPVLLKAVSGGGGKGMRQVWSGEEFDEALAAAKREALSSFGDDRMLVEKYLTRPRHVEIQVFCDSHGNAVYLAERDCSVQRRHQKVIEEAPAPGVSDELRRQMGETAVRSAQAIDYVNAGTVEFLLDEDGSFYFMEMNTRLQVEHPVTEMITGQDLVEWQLRVAAGETLPLAQDEIVLRGHAFEARIYAEDTDNDFLPATGTLNYLQPPTESRHVRVDTGVLQGDEVSVYYDPMIAKLIVWDEDRTSALNRLAQSLRDYRISGVTTNIDFLYNLATTDAFRQAELDTSFITKHHDAIFHDKSGAAKDILPLCALYLALALNEQSSVNAAQTDPHSPWAINDAWRLNEPHQQRFELRFQGADWPVTLELTGRGASRRYRIEVDGHSCEVQGELEGNDIVAVIDGHRQRATVAVHDDTYSLYTQDYAVQFSRVPVDLGDLELDGGGDASLAAPMNGTVVALVAAVGETVSKGETLMVMEAMKMEHTIKAPSAGKVLEYFYQPGSLIEGGALLLEFDATEE